MGYNSFEELDACPVECRLWRPSFGGFHRVKKRACRLAVGIYESLRNCRDYGLKDQMTRSAVSIASNIAEGAERNSKAEYIRFLHIAKGSAAELRTQVYIAQQIGIYQNTQATELVAELKEISSMLQGLIKSLTLKT